MDRDSFFLFPIPEIMVPSLSQPPGTSSHQSSPQTSPPATPGTATLPKTGKGWQKFLLPSVTVHSKIIRKLSTLIP